MPTATTTRPGFVTDRAGFPLFISWRAAVSWLTTSGRALQCPDCSEIHDSATEAFECCDARSAYPVLADAHDRQLLHNITADELVERL